MGRWGGKGEELTGSSTGDVPVLKLGGEFLGVHFIVMLCNSCISLCIRQISYIT